MLRLAILGAGRFAHNHFEALKRLTKKSMITVVGRKHVEAPCPEAEELGVHVVTTDQAICSRKVDAVLICLPNYLHHPYAEMALQNGLHVFCEKPLAMTVDDADALIALAEKQGKVLMTGHLTRHTALYRAVADALAQGDLGKPLALYSSRLQVGGQQFWRMDPALGGGAPFDLLAHDFDLMNWFLGRPRTVMAVGHRHEDGAFDHVSALFTFDNGATAVIDGGFLLTDGADFSSMLRVVCENGHVLVDTSDREAPVRIHRAGGGEEQPQFALHDLKISGLTRELDEFIDATNGKPRNELRCQDARQAVECAELSVRAASEGRVVDFPKRV